MNLNQHRFLSGKDALTDTQKGIIKGELGMYQGTVYELMQKGLWNRATDYHSKEMKLQRTEKTSRVCRTCFGERTVIERYVGHGDMVVRTTCPQCLGSGEVFG